MNTDVNLDVKVFPIDDPKGNTLAFASIAIDDLAAIRGLRIVDSEKGLFVAMPQSQDNTGIYHDVAFPIMKGLREDITNAVIDEFTNQLKLSPDERGYEGKEASGGVIKRAEDVDIDVKVYPINEPKGNILAYASVALNDMVAIRGIRVMDSERGKSVILPQSQDKNNISHDIAFPLSGDVRKAISNIVLSEYKQAVAERKQSLGDKLAEGAERVKNQVVNAPMQAMAAAKRTPGLGD